MSSRKGKAQPVGINMTPSKTELGKFIRDRRLELNMRQVPLSKFIGFTGNHISMIEIGKQKYLNDQQLTRLAKALQVDVEELRKRMPVKLSSQTKTELGRLIRSRREKLGLSLSTFAKKMRITPQQAKKLEVKRSRTIRCALVQPLANALKLDLSVLVPFATQKETKSKLGQLVRRRRLGLGMSSDVLAERLDVSKQFVNQIELGQCRLSESSEMIKKLAQILNLDVNELEAVRPTRRPKPMNTINPLGRFLAERRLELRLSQREVADRAEISCGYVSGVETGRLQPSLNLLDKLTKALDTQIPSDLIPTPQDRKNSHRGLGVRIERKTALGKFVTTRRLELQLSQAQVAEHAGITTAVVSGIERGTYRLGSLVLEKLTRALECEIPAELVSIRQSHRLRTRTASDILPSSMIVRLSEQNLSDLEKIKELSDIHVNTEVVRKAVKLLRRLLEKLSDGYVVCLCKDDDRIELQFMF